jgi:nucleotide-binding universal stress UspA family protein
MQIQTVLCPVDFSPLEERELDVAVEVCRVFGARLVLHHNFAAAEPGFSRAWEWEKANHHNGHDGGRREAERHMRALVDRVGRGLRAEALITTGPLGTVVVAVAEQIGADLIVLGSHGWSTQDHASVTERVIDTSPCPVLTFQERTAGRPPFRLRPGRDEEPARVVVPTDLSEASAAAVGYACALARAIPIRLDLMHVGSPSMAPEAIAAAQVSMDRMIPPDLVDRVAAHVLTGRPVEAIASYLDATVPAFAILGEHAHGLFRRFFTRDTTRELVHRVECPVWVVPPRVRV